MIFNSIEFGLFLAVVLAVYWALPHKAQNRFLLAASYFFYGWWDWRFLGLLMFSTVVDFLVARRMSGQAGGPGSNPQRRKILLALSIATNLGVLGVFKYLGFFADSLNGSLEALGMSSLAPTVSVVLPVGISFYTFQSMSYTIDVYRDKIGPVHSIFDFALYVSFFPQLVAGPIERATRLVPQLVAPREYPTAERAMSGVYLIVIGLVKKVVIADMASGVVDSVFDRSGSAGAIELVIGVYAFAIQIYGDFSGYSDMARGIARLLGIELVENFRQPYLATSITDFWRRWHISLSDWLRDYLYIPLGGNRRGPRRTYINLMATMLLGGLWHGASWTFVVWGLLHGLYLIAERRLNVSQAVSARSWPGLARVALTFHLVCLAWVFFRAETFSQAADVIAGIILFRSGSVPFASLLNTVVFLGGIMLFIDVIQRFLGDEVGVRKLHPSLQGAFFGVSFSLIILMSGGESVPFVYFQF